MNIDEPGDERIIDEDFHSAFDENLFQDLVADDILDPDLNLDIPNMEVLGKVQASKGHKEWWLLIP